jgi:hypothetical protein
MPLPKKNLQEGKKNDCYVFCLENEKVNNHFSNKKRPETEF